MNRQGTLWMVITGAVIAAGCGGGEVQSAGDPGMVYARTVAAEEVDVPEVVEVMGSVEAARLAGVSSRVMATVTAVRVRAGDLVRAGQTVVDIDPDTAKGQEAQAQGALAQAEAALVLARRNLERFQNLAASGAAAELELDLARMQYEQALGAVTQAEGALAAAGSVARESRVVAPFDGRVAARLVEVGDLAMPGRPLIMVESLRGRRLRVAVPESVVGASGVKPGTVVAVRLDGSPKLGELRGEVVEMSPGADPATHTFGVWVEIPDQNVATGSAGRAWLAIGHRKVVAVPSASILQPGGVSMVVIRDRDGLARSRVVSVGAPLTEDRVEVLAGLQGGETVLTGVTTIPANGARVMESGS